MFTEDTVGASATLKPDKQTLAYTNEQCVYKLPELISLHR